MLPFHRGRFEPTDRHPTTAPHRQWLADMWDAINEVIMPVLAQEDNGITRLSGRLGRIGTIPLAFDAARAVNPHAALLLYDFDTSSACDTPIEGALEAGVRIGAPTGLVRADGSPKPASDRLHHLVRRMADAAH